MVHEAVEKIREKYSSQPIIGVVGGNSALPSEVLKSLGYELRNGLTSIDGISFVAGLPDWLPDLYQGINDCRMMAARKASFGSEVPGMARPDTNLTDRFFILLPEDCKTSYQDRFKIYFELQEINKGCVREHDDLTYHLVGKDKQEMVTSAAVELADAVVVFGGNGHLLKYINQLLDRGKYVVPIISYNGSSELLAKFANHLSSEPSPREVAKLMEFGVAATNLRRELIKPVYSPPHLGTILSEIVRELKTQGKPPAVISSDELKPVLEIVPDYVPAESESADRIAALIAASIEERGYKK